MGIKVISCTVKPSQTAQCQLEAFLEFSVYGTPSKVSMNGTNNQYVLAERLYDAIRQHAEVPPHKVDKVKIDSSGAYVILLNSRQEMFNSSARGNNPAESAVLAYISALDELVHWGV